MTKYYILSLNNNTYAEFNDGVKINSSFDSIFDDNDKISKINFPSYGNGLIIGEENDGVMKDIITLEEIEYIPRDEEKVNKENYLEIKNAQISYYDKKEIPESFVSIILSRYNAKNVLRYMECMYGIRDRNMELYGKKLNLDEEIVDMNEVNSPKKYINDFKRKIKVRNYSLKLKEM